MQLDDLCIVSEGRMQYEDEPVPILKKISDELRKIKGGGELTNQEWPYSTRMEYRVPQTSQDLLLQ
jgi:hypothetical protein